MKALEYLNEWLGIYAAILKQELAEDRANIATAIMQEVAKDRRMAEIRAEKKQGFGTVQFNDATDKQCKLMDQLGIAYDKSTTKDEASRLISEKLESGAKNG